MEQAILETIAAKQAFLLTGHERPDGDCLGSQVGLYHLLVALGKTVHVVNPDPLTDTHAFLSRHTPFASFDRGVDLPEFDVVVLLDCAQLSRLDALGERLRSKGAFVAVIDHHVGSENGDGAVHFVDSSAAATGELVYRLFKKLDLPIGQAAAEGIFLSLISDTGWFRYSNTNADVLRIAAELIESGVDASALYDRIFRQNHIDSVRLIETVLETHTFSLGGKFGYVCIDKSSMAEANRIDFDTDMVLEPMRSVAGIEVVALFKERYDGGVKLSLRASGDIDVAEIAGAFGGGGHVKAAGATLELSMPESVEAVEHCVRDALAVLRNGSKP